MSVIVSLGFLTSGASAADFELTWNDNSDSEEGFKVERSTDGVTFSVIAQVGANVTTYIDDQLGAGDTYYYRVYAFNNVGSSEPTNVAVANKPLQAPDVSISSSLSENGYAIGESVSFGVTLSGDDSDLDRVDYYLDGTLAASAEQSPWGVAFSGAESGVRQVYAKAVNSNGEISVSASVEFLVNAELPYDTVSSGEVVLSLDKIGEGADNGSVSLGGNSETITLSSKSGDAWGSLDDVDLIWTTVTGDFEVVANVESVTFSNQHAKYGIMIRQNLDGDSINAFAYVKPSDDRVWYGDRVEIGGLTSTDYQSNSYSPSWLKLKRDGDTITAFCSEDGVSWTEYARNELAFNAEVYVGLAIAAKNTETAGVGVFSDFDIDLTNELPVVSSIDDVSILVSEDIPDRTFTISDAETGFDDLNIAVSSSNQSLVKDSSITVVRSGTNITLEIEKELGEVGVAQISVSVDDGVSTVVEEFSILVQGTQAPIIGYLSDVSVLQGRAFGTISLNVLDNDTAVNTLVLSVSSSNATLLSDSGIDISGTGEDRTINITYDQSRYGTSTVRIEVEDSDGNSSFEEFTVEVLENTGIPMIREIEDLSAYVSRSIEKIGLVISDSDNEFSEISATATSSNESVLRSTEIEFEGDTGSRWITVSPEAGVSGTTTIEVTVTDGVNQTQESFELTILPDEVPVISDISDRDVLESRSLVSVEFIISDDATLVDGLVLAVSSSNSSIIDSSSLRFAGDGATRSLVFDAVPTVVGSTTITITAFDGYGTGTKSFSVNVEDDTVPEISEIQNQTILEGGLIGPISFTVEDLETSELSVSVSSDNDSLFPSGSMVLVGTGSDRTLTLTPEDALFGEATVVVAVSDGLNSITETFDVFVNENTVPVISLISDQNVNQGVTVGPIEFTVSDSESTDLSVSISSDNDALFNEGSLLVQGDGSTRTFTLQPGLASFGRALVEIAVSDGYNRTTESFTLTVTQNTAPTISSIADQVVAQGGVVGPIGFNIGDEESSELSVTISSNNSALLPSGSMLITGAGTNRAFSLQPGSSAFGEAVVELVVSDGMLSSSTTFKLSVEERIAIRSQSIDVESTGDGETVLSVDASGANLTYQWYKGAAGDASKPVAGATSRELVLRDVAQNAQYWVQVSSEGRVLENGVVNSETVVVNYNPYPRFYFGEFAGRQAGQFALSENEAGKAVFLGVLENANSAPNSIGSGTSDYSVASVSGEAMSLKVDEVVVDDNGGFNFTVEQFGTVVGIVANGEVSLSLPGETEISSGEQDRSELENAEYAGTYNASVSNSADGEIVVIAGPSGKAFVYSSIESESFGGMVEIDSNGEIESDLSGEGRVEIQLTESSLVRGVSSFANEEFSVTGRSKAAVEVERLVNTKMASQAGEGSNTMIAGFVIEGEGSKRMLIRGVGPSLSEMGYSGEVVDTALTLYRYEENGSYTEIAANDDWSDALNSAAISTTGDSVDAFELPAGSKDAAILVDLPAGVYTAHVIGVNGTAMAEIYDADEVEEGTAAATNLVNISMRGKVVAEDSTVTAGFVVTGEIAKRYMIRSVGSELGALGVTGTLADPNLELFKADGDELTRIALNNDWTDDESMIASISETIGASDLDGNSKSSAIAIWLEPGIYTAVCKSANGGEGVTLVEVYEIP